VPKGKLALYVSANTAYFGGVQSEPEDAEFIVIGVPFDSTASYRPGTRFAPSTVRQAAANIEFYSPRRGLDIENTKIHDLGDVMTVADPRRQVNIVADVADNVVSTFPSTVPVFIGGEHTVTYGIVKGIRTARGTSPCLIVLDAHLDLRDEFMGDKFSHACVLRRIIDDRLVDSVLVLGARAFVKEEAEYSVEANVSRVDALVFRRGEWKKVIDVLRGTLDACSSHLHVSIDMDVYDPAYAPGVGNPEPEGLTPTEVFDIIHYIGGLARERGLRVSLDVVETNPLVDTSGVTSVLAAKTIVEYIAALTSYSS